MDIQAITTVSQLQALLPLLEASYGGAVDWEEERSYFEATRPPDGWWLQVAEQPVGFIRHFAVTPQLSQMEVYVQPDHEALETQLVAHFCAHLQFPGAVRVCLPAQAQTRYARFQQLGFQRVQRFLHFDFTAHSLAQAQPGVRWAQASDLPGVVAALAHFGNLSETQLQQAIAQQRVAVVTAGAVVGAAYLQATAQGHEILELAVCPSYRERGYGTQLLTGLFALWREAKANQPLNLVVDADNTAAVALYHKVGMALDPALESVWLYRDPPAPQERPVRLLRGRSLRHGS